MQLQGPTGRGDPDFPHLPIVTLLVSETQRCLFTAHFFLASIINPRHACAARVPVVGLSVWSVCPSACLLVNISRLEHLSCLENAVTYSTGKEKKRFVSEIQYFPHCMAFYTSQLLHLSHMYTTPPSVHLMYMYIASNDSLPEVGSMNPDPRPLR